MAALKIQDLPAPRAPRRVGCDTERPDGQIKFRSVKKETREEKVRARALSGFESPNLLRVLRARQLGKCIEQGVDRGEPPATLASALHH